MFNVVAGWKKHKLLLLALAYLVVLWSLALTNKQVADQPTNTKCAHRSVHFHQPVSSSIPTKMNFIYYIGLLVEHARQHCMFTFVAIAGVPAYVIHIQSHPNWLLCDRGECRNVNTTNDDPAHFFTTYHCDQGLSRSHQVINKIRP